MGIESLVLQIIIALGILNVWLFRYNKATIYRGGDSQTLKQEFKAYGLPEPVYFFIGFLKISSAVSLVASIWFPVLTLYTASLVAILMVGALIMHIKVKDPIKKSIPAIAMLLMSISLALISVV